MSLPHIVLGIWILRTALKRCELAWNFTAPNFLDRIWVKSATRDLQRNHVFLSYFAAECRDLRFCTATSVTCKRQWFNQVWLSRQSLTSPCWCLQMQIMRTYNRHLDFGGGNGQRVSRPSFSFQLEKNSQSIKSCYFELPPILANTSNKRAK